MEENLIRYDGQESQHRTGRTNEERPSYEPPPLTDIPTKFFWPSSFSPFPFKFVSPLCSKMAKTYTPEEAEALVHSHDPEHVRDLFSFQW